MDTPGDMNYNLKKVEDMDRIPVRDIVEIYLFCDVLGKFQNSVHLPSYDFYNMLLHEICSVY